MRIVLLITIAFLLSTAAVAELNAQNGETAVSRVPRALILQPVMKVREEEDDGPLDWIANLFRGMTAPKRRAPSVRPMLGPIRVPGVNDEVYIKQLRSLSNANNRVVVRVMNPPMQQMSVPMAIPTPYYTYYQTPQFPIGPTRQLPMPSSGFVPMSSPAPTPVQWQRPQQNAQQYTFNRNNYQNGFNYSPPKYQNHQQWQASHQPFYQSHYQQQNPYGTHHDFDNSIQNSGRVSNYISEPVRSTNHPYPPFNEGADVNGNGNGNSNSNIQDIKNQTIISGEVFDEGNDNEAKYSEAKQSKVTPALESAASLASSSTNTYKEIYRPDRMAPTSSTWRSQLWSRKQKNGTTAGLGKDHDHDHNHGHDQNRGHNNNGHDHNDNGHDQNHNHNHGHDHNDHNYNHGHDHHHNHDHNHNHNHDDEDQLLRERGKGKLKFSRTDMIEVAAPDLKGQNRRGNEEKRSELNVNNGSTMVDGRETSPDESSHKSVTKEMEKRNFRPTVVTEIPKIQGRVTRRRNQWTPLDVVPTQNSFNVRTTKNVDDSSDFGGESTERGENATPDVIQKVMSLTADNSWKNREAPKGGIARNYGRLNDSIKNRNRRVRIVESVRSSVSVTSSKGERVKSMSKS